MAVQADGYLYELDDGLSWARRTAFIGLAAAYFIGLALIWRVGNPPFAGLSLFIAGGVLAQVIPLALGPMRAVAALAAPLEDVVAAAERVLAKERKRAVVVRGTDSASVSQSGWSDLLWQRRTYLLRGDRERCAIEAQTWPVPVGASARRSSLRRMEAQVAAIAYEVGRSET